MANKIYNMAIVGYGGMGSYHTKLIEPVDSIQVTGVFDINKDRMEAAAEKGYKAYESLNELLADGTVDIVLIATPNDVHRDLAISSLRL
jgi:predicted dehydrogenase